MRSRILRYVLFVAVALTGSEAAMAQYVVQNLDSNQFGLTSHTDPLMVNAWGLARGATGPWWVADEASGWSTLYDGSGNIQSLRVLIPTGGANGPGSPTGMVVNNSSEFNVEGWPSVFLFATLDGTISGWAPQSNFNDAIVAVNNSSSGAVYTGLAITSKSSGNFLYAANLAKNQVEMYDGSFNLLSTFTDPNAPSGFAPFGIQDINGIVFVAFASTTGGSGGLIDEFTESGSFIKTLTQGTPLNQPWGMAAAPANFGPLSNTLLVTNNTNVGTIHGFDLATGKLVGLMKGQDNKTILIDQLWGIAFGGGNSNSGAANNLYFTAGPKNNLTGTFGVIRP